MNYTANSLQGLLEVFDSNTFPRKLKPRSIYGALMISGVQGKEMKEALRASVDNLFDAEIGPGLADTISALRLHDTNAGKRPMARTTIIDEHTKSYDYAGAKFDSGAIIDEYILETNSLYLSKSLMIEGINDREVFVFRFSYGGLHANAFEMHTMNINEGLTEYMSSNTVPITTYQKY